MKKQENETLDDVFYRYGYYGLRNVLIIAVGGILIGGLIVGLLNLLGK